MIIGLNCGISTMTTIMASKKIRIDGRKSSIPPNRLDIVNQIRLWLDIVNQIRLCQKVLSATISFHTEFVQNLVLGRVRNRSSVNVLGREERVGTGSSQLPNPSLIVPPEVCQWIAAIHTTDRDDHVY